MDWDAEVDVLCAGAGIAGLATAIAAVDAGVEVMVAGALPFADDRWVRDRVPGSSGGCATTLGAVLRSRIEASGVLRVAKDQGDDDVAEAAADDHPSEIADDDAVAAMTGHHRGDDRSADQVDATAVYFAALTEDSDVDPESIERQVTEQYVSTRTVHELSESERDSRTVETFFGARLADWAQECLGSATAAVYSTVRGWSASTVQDVAGRRVRLAPIGTIDWGVDDGPGELFDWLAAAVAERDIAVSPASTLAALVLEDRRIVGAELQTSDGPYLVRARHGVTISPDFVDAVAVPSRTGGGGAPLTGALQVCLVGYPASRFARVELVAR
ncbi:MAG: hypothetical protein P4L86_14130 [Mycobacterium sp.]|nr:hypothetical protein [Mycobacterium sp.]